MPLLIRGEDQRGSGGYQSVIDVHDARYGFHDFLCVSCQLLQYVVIIAEYLYLDGFGRTHQIA